MQYSIETEGHILSRCAHADITLFILEAVNEQQDRKHHLHMVTAYTNRSGHWFKSKCGQYMVYIHEDISHMVDSMVWWFSNC